MLELLKPKQGEHIIDVGAGSGWQSALLAHIVGANGHVYAIEIVPSLFERARQILEQFIELKKRVTFFCQSAAPGLPDIASKIGGFDGIIAAAEVHDTPQAWMDQLKTGGRLVYPKAHAIVLETKQQDGMFHAQIYPGFVFVPFVNEGP